MGGANVTQFDWSSTSQTSRYQDNHYINLSRHHDDDSEKNKNKNNYNKNIYKNIANNNKINIKNNKKRQLKAREKPEKSKVSEWFGTNNIEVLFIQFCAVNI